MVEAGDESGRLGTPQVGLDREVQVLSWRCHRSGHTRADRHGSARSFGPGCGVGLRGTLGLRHDLGVRGGVRIQEVFVVDRRPDQPYGLRKLGAREWSSAVE
jgi:hypothetical protein